MNKLARIFYSSVNKKYYLRDIKHWKVSKNIIRAIYLQIKSTRFHFLVVELISAQLCGVRFKEMWKADAPNKEGLRLIRLMRIDHRLSASVRDSHPVVIFHFNRYHNWPRQTSSRLTEGSARK